MGRKIDLKSCKTHDEFCRWSSQNDLTVSNGAKHTKVSNERGATYIPRHPGELKTGTRFAIIKQLAALIAVLMLVAYISGIF